ncbi:hypothetical protein GUITHDRAFT_150375 [Guillardia theta CCMP2712]|uniref:Mitochondrial import inner membrane translocase subunit n=1 Tax=Guillardia theta (strain CCMP2712) TaxID=905079 RepID=L1JYP6_GUITC|nr:hypothetical protein GUITHDRAFT_150375 [Guillardia theta CCMP2712]EKX53315.1 hypothetical protein GUITHDRAFT_150375 [Guillardia theta CCMP2712]|eukprot:XP_005840295.1 hypothetical protein GUITHDRAFT_150375 [Guillardia theta CCMP2712]
MSKQEQEQRVNNAKNEISAFSDMYNRMLKQCFEKCVEHYHDSELALGENVCIDRCVSKYVSAQEKVGATMTKVTSQMQQI